MLSNTRCAGTDRAHGAQASSINAALTWRIWRIWRAQGKQVYDKNAEGHQVTLYRPESFAKKSDPYAWDYGGLYGTGGPAPDSWADKRVAGRPLGSVILPLVQGRGREEELRDDVARFFSPEEARFYRARGMPHRRGYLLHGVPGSGKTSVIKAIACDLNLPIFQVRSLIRT